MKVSICIPVYGMQGKGVEYLKQALDSLQSQTSNDYEVVVSDDSTDSVIEDFIQNSLYKMDLKYVKNTSGKKGNSGNMNNAIKYAGHEIIKPLFQDDWVVNNNMIEDIINSKSNWGALGYMQSNGKRYLPKWNNLMLYGKNTIGAPSGIWFKKADSLLFDDNLTLLMDTEFYYRLKLLYGNPLILNELYYVSRVWDGQISHTIDTRYYREKELLLLRKKFHKSLNIYIFRLSIFFDKFKLSNIIKKLKNK